MWWPIILMLFWTIVATTGQRSSTRSRIRLPEGQQWSSNTRRSLPPPDVQCDEEDTYCEKVPNYPTDIISRKVNITSFNSYQPRELGFSGRRRPTDGDTEEQRVCEVDQHLIFPKAAIDSKQKWRYLVNDNKNKQPIVIEKCRRRNSPCTVISDSLGIGFKTRCAHLYINKVMIAFDENSLQTYPDNFQFPVACVCYVKNRYYPFTSSS